MPTKAIHISETERQALLEIESSVRSYHPVSEFILFGSKARGDCGPDSDADLLIITETALSQREKDHVSEIIFEINLKYGANFSRVIVDRNAWDNGLPSVLPLHGVVMREGIRV